MPNETTPTTNFVKFEDITLKTPLDQIQPLTMQEIFDRALLGIRGQKGVSAVYEARIIHPRYRGPENSRCAAGHCIPQGLFEEWMEQKTIGDVLERLMEHSSTPPLVHLLGRPGSPTALLLVMIQRAHDREVKTSPVSPFFDRERFEITMTYIAKGEGLVYTPPPEPAIAA